MLGLRLLFISLLLWPAIASAVNLLDGPECVDYDPVGDRYLVSSLNDGTIVAIDREGNQSLFAGGYNITFGLVIVDNVIYFSTSSRVIGIDLTTEETVFNVEVIGAHPYGWANPPDSTAYAQDPAESGTDAPSHNNHPSFFFADTLRDYRAILDQSGRSEMPIWSTEFGWGSYDGFGRLPPEGVEYMAYVDEWQQATYILRAYELAHDWEWAGPLFLWNLNFAPTFGPDFVESAYSLLRPDGAPRPVYKALPALVNGE